MGGGVGGGIPSDYLVSTQLQLWLFCCWGCGCCWAVTISSVVIGPKIHYSHGSNYTRAYCFPSLFFFIFETFPNRVKQLLFFGLN